MQEPDHRDDHDPPRLTRALAAAAFVVLACAGNAGGARLVTLPSPLTALSAEPPLSGGAAASAENVRHRITARTDVEVSVDRRGTPFAVVARQRLDVRVLGDYFLSVGAPVRDVRPVAGSASVPGLRPGSILWAGFNPGHRVLDARATLDPRAAARGLPLRVEVHTGGVTLTNLTRVDVDAFAADAPRAPLLAYLRRLASDVALGRTPTPASVPVSSQPVRARVPVVVPLHVTGTIGATPVDVELDATRMLSGSGPVDLRVEPIDLVRTSGLGSLDGRGLLRATTIAALTVARTRQYESYLGNPDPSGRSSTTYRYRTAAPPMPVATAVKTRGHDWLDGVLVAAGIAAALAGAAVVWARS